MLKGLASIALVVVGVAFAAGQEVRSEAPRPAPVGAVPPSVCIANGPVVAVTESPDAPGVYHVTCASGVVLVSGPR